MTELILIRGLPGSGKSTMAQHFTLIGFKHYEADQYFMKDGEYVFDPSCLQQAHEWCFVRTKRSLIAGERVVVSNTFTREWELAPYIQFAQELGRGILLLEATGTWANCHGVSEEILNKMKARWESTEAIRRKYGLES